MCGIFCSVVSPGRRQSVSASAEMQARLLCRGPDSQRTEEAIYPGPSEEEEKHSGQPTLVSFCSTVLALRGSVTVTQPYIDPDRRYTLCWNGEAWSINGEPTSGNDTQIIYQLLVDSLQSCSRIDAASSATNVAETLSRVAGPYAFVFFDHSRGHLYFGRDFLGRRSLLRRVTDDGDLILSSVSDGNSEEKWTEVEANGVYCIDLSYIQDLGGSNPLKLLHIGSFAAVLAPYRFAHHAQHTTGSLKSVIPRLSLNKDIPSDHCPLTEGSNSVIHLEDLLHSSLHYRIMQTPDPPISASNLQALERSKLALLFSGGLDCTILARLAHNQLPPNEPVDLLNVAFENPRIHKESATDAQGTFYELCPDRITGRASYEELRTVCPGREWRFVAINIPYTQTMEHREKVISLMYPHNTEMDLSISFALYFAARGSGQITTPDGDSIPYTTTSRVLLSGLGADELFGGYTRHGNAYRRGGFNGLVEELELDVSRLGQRNLGRDDRVMAHWSKEVRFPFLDEDLVRWAVNAPVTDKCGFGEPHTDSPEQGESGTEMLDPEKKVLRCLAWRLGMRGVAKEKKRAIQFGARTAKMETRKTKGTQVLS